MLRAAAQAARRVRGGARHRAGACRRGARGPPHGAAARSPTPPDALRPQGTALAAQQRRCLADAAVAPKAGAIWDELGDLVTSDEGKRELATLRSTYADISQKLAALAKARGARRVGAAVAAPLAPFARSLARSLAPRSPAPPLLLLQPQDPIDWAAWSKEVDPKLIQQFKTAFESAPRRRAEQRRRPTAGGAAAAADCGQRWQRCSGDLEVSAGQPWQPAARSSDRPLLPPRAWRACGCHQPRAAPRRR